MKKKKALSTMGDSSWSFSDSSKDSDDVESPSTKGLEIYSPNEDSLLSFNSSKFSPKLIYHPSKARHEAAKREAAAHAADALGRDLEAMGYNLDCETFITKGSSVGDYPKERYNPPNTLQATSSLDDESRVSDIISSLRSHSDVILNMRSNASIDPIQESRSSPVKQPKKAFPKHHMIPQAASTTSSSYLVPSHSHFSVKADSSSHGRGGMLDESPGSSSVTDSEMIDQWRQDKVDNLLRRIERTKKEEEDPVVVETVKSDATSSQASSKKSEVPPPDVVSNSSSVSGRLFKTNSSVSPSKMICKTASASSKASSSSKLQQIASSISGAPSKDTSVHHKASECHTKGNELAEDLVIEGMSVVNATSESLTPGEAALEVDAGAQEDTDENKMAVATDKTSNRRRRGSPRKILAKARMLKAAREKKIEKQQDQVKEANELAEPISLPEENQNETQVGDATPLISLENIVDEQNSSEKDSEPIIEKSSNDKTRDNTPQEKKIKTSKKSPEAPWIRLRSGFGSNRKAKKDKKNTTSKKIEVRSGLPKFEKPVEPTKIEEPVSDANNQAVVEEREATGKVSAAVDLPPSQREMSVQEPTDAGIEESADNDTLQTAMPTPLTSVLSPEASFVKKSDDLVTEPLSKTKIIGPAKKKRMVSFSLFKHRDDTNTVKKQPGGKKRKGIMKKSKPSPTTSANTPSSPQSTGSALTSTSHNSAATNLSTKAENKVSYVGYDIETNEGVEVVAIAQTIALASPQASLAGSLASFKSDIPSVRDETSRKMVDKTCATSPSHSDQQVEVVLEETDEGKQMEPAMNPTDKSKIVSSGTAFDWNFFQGFSAVPSKSGELNAKKPTTDKPTDKREVAGNDEDAKSMSLFSMLAGLSLPGNSVGNSERNTDESLPPAEKASKDQQEKAKAQKATVVSKSTIPDDDHKSTTSSKAKKASFFDFWSNNTSSAKETQIPVRASSPRDGAITPASIASMKNDKSVLSAYLAEKSEAGSRSAPERSERHDRVQDFLDSQLKGQEEHSFPSGMDPEKNPKKAFFYQKLAKRGKHLLTPEKKSSKKKVPRVPSRLICENGKDEASCLTYNPPSILHDEKSSDKEVDEILDSTDWDEIADASLVVERAIKKIEPSELASVKSFDTKSVGEEVEKALLVLKKHARRLGVKESDLLLAVKSQDAETIASSKHKRRVSDSAKSIADSVKTMTIGEEILEVFKMYLETK